MRKPSELVIRGKIVSFGAPKKDSRVDVTDQIMGREATLPRQLQTLSDDKKIQLSREIATIFDSLRPETEAKAKASKAAIQRDAQKIGLHVVTQRQFRMIEWSTKQLKIRQLQEECDRILEEIKTL